MKLVFAQHKLAIYTHVFASFLALSLGPFQFSRSLRKRKPVLHRYLGRIYLGIGVLLGGLAGLFLSYLAQGGAVAKLGFAVLALLWLYTGLRAYFAIRAGRIGQHRKWMIRNFSLTFAAVTLRLYLPIVILLNFNFMNAYALIAWLCWVPNLILAERVFNQKKIQNTQQ